MEAASKLVKQRSMEALNSIRVDTSKLVMVTVTVLALGFLGHPV